MNIYRANSAKYKKKKSAVSLELESQMKKKKYQTMNRSFR